MNDGTLTPGNTQSSLRTAPTSARGPERSCSGYGLLYTNPGGLGGCKFTCTSVWWGRPQRWRAPHLFPQLQSALALRKLASPALHLPPLPPLRTAANPRHCPGSASTSRPLHIPTENTVPPDMSATKGPAPQKYDGSSLRVAIVHARWNRTIIDPLVQGAKDKLLECGVKEANIVTQTVPGSWELPTAVQRYAPAARLHPSPACITPHSNAAPPPTDSSRRRRSRAREAGDPSRRATSSDPRRRISRLSRLRRRPMDPLTPSSLWAY